MRQGICRVLCTSRVIRNAWPIISWDSLSILHNGTPVTLLCLSFPPFPPRPLRGTRRMASRFLYPVLAADDNPGPVAGPVEIGIVRDAAQFVW